MSHLAHLNHIYSCLTSTLLPSPHLTSALVDSSVTRQSSLYGVPRDGRFLKFSFAGQLDWGKV
ncbi:hypothetical protein E2C01_091115 [Portunus trituberculatus]|uniref:Uncharacterized protein n=1 Tax=Portunus trituberculatus TaxID=210409 RepID=A0A5B7JNJ0_PORTR|nr:hypothetical protein [Portunus trituberculatus]